MLTVLLLQRRRESVNDASQDLQQLPDAVVSRALVHKPTSGNWYGKQREEGRGNFSGAKNAASTTGGIRTSHPPTKTTETATGTNRKRKGKDSMIGASCNTGSSSDTMSTTKPYPLRGTPKPLSRIAVARAAPEEGVTHCPSYESSVHHEFPVHAMKDCLEVVSLPRVLAAPTIIASRRKQKSGRYKRDRERETCGFNNVHDSGSGSRSTGSLDIIFLARRYQPTEWND